MSHPNSTSITKSKMKKRRRTANYTQVEKEQVLRLADKYKEILDTKKLDASAIRQKNVTWDIIAEEFNVTALVPRTGPLLRSCYDTMKKLARQQLAAANNDTMESNDMSQTDNSTDEAPDSVTLGDVGLSAEEVSGSNFTVSHPVEGSPKRRLLVTRDPLRSSLNRSHQPTTTAPMIQVRSDLHSQEQSIKIALLEDQIRVQRLQQDHLQEVLETERWQQERLREETETEKIRREILKVQLEREKLLLERNRRQYEVVELAMQDAKESMIRY